MAIFNPQVPEEQVPSYLGLSKPVGQPSVGSKSALSEAVKGIGEIYAGAVKTADTAIKMSAQEEVQNKFRIQRDIRTAELEATRDTISGVGQVESGSSTTDTRVPVGPFEQAEKQPLDLLANRKPLPAELENLPRTLGTLSNARANGKMSQTFYYQRLNSLAQDIRSRYPLGYREYIDTEIAKVTGVDPANAYMSSLMADINASVGAARDSRSKVITDISQAVEKGYDGAHRIRARFVAGEIPETAVYEYINKFAYFDYQNKERQREREESSANLTQAKELTIRHASQEAAEQAYKMLYVVEATGGQRFRDLMELSKSGQISGPDALELGKHMSLLENRYVEAMNQWFMKRDSKGNSPLMLVGGNTEANKVIEGGKLIFQQMIKSINDKDFGAINFAKRAVDVAVSEKGLQMVNDKDLREFMLLMGVMQQYPNSLSARFFEERLTKQPGLSNGIKVFLDKELMTMITQPGAVTGQVNTLNQSIQNIVDKGVTTMPEAFEGVVQLIDNKEYGLVSEKTPIQAKINIAKAFFHPDNRGVLSRFEKESRDPATGRTINGQFSFYDRAASPDVTRTMWELGKQDKNLWLMYKDWAEQTFGQELLRGAVREFNDDNMTKYGLVADWDDDFKQWNVSIDPKLPPETRVQVRARVLPSVQRKIDNVNRALGHLTEVAKQEKREDEIDAYLWQKMVQFGLEIDPSKPLDGVPREMLEAIITKKRIQEEEAEELRSKYRTKKKKSE